MENKLYADIGKGYIDLYLSSPKGKSNSFVKYRLLHIVKPYTDGGTMQNQDLWRLWELYTYEKNGDKLIQSLPYKVMSAGEWECAFKIFGTPDFHGGFHGYEHLTEVSVRADGEPLTLDVPEKHWLDRFEFLQKSRIVRQGTRDETVAYHTKKYRFENGAVEIKQELCWECEADLQFAYMAMLPIRRTHNDKPDGEQISDRIMINDGPTVYDIEKEGHMTPISSHKNLTGGVSYAKVWGESSGLVAEVTVSGTKTESETFMVQNNETYNKLYFSFAGAGKGYKTNIGEKWNSKTKYEIYRV